MRPTHPIRILAYAAAGAALVLAVGAGAAAQDEAPHPAHIHDGSCETIGDIVHPLSDVSAESLVDGQPGAGDVVGDPSDDPADLVQVSITTVDATIEELTSAEFAINVHLSADEMGVFIACGDVAGALVLDDPDETDETDDESDETDDDVALAIRLREQNDSGAQGIAWLASGDDDEQTIVHLFVVQDPLPEAVPAVSPAAEVPIATDAPVDSPAPVESLPADSPAPTAGTSTPPAESPAPPAESPAPPAESVPPPAESPAPPAESPAA